jgi:hypothetical protein
MEYYTRFSGDATEGKPIVIYLDVSKQKGGYGILVLKAIFSESQKFPFA